MRKLFLSILAGMFVLTVSLAGAAPLTLKEKVINASAKNAQINALSEKDFDKFTRYLEKGNNDWIRMVPDLAEHTDASYSEGLTISLARGLLHNPSAILAILSREGNTPVSIKRVCSVPFIEISDKEANRYIKQANIKIKQIHLPELQNKKAECLQVLNLPAGSASN